MEDNSMELTSNFGNCVSFSPHRKSFVEDFLKEEEKIFLMYVREGDIDAIKTLLSLHKNLNVNCCDYRGQRALDIAILNGDTDLVEFLVTEITASVVHYYCAILRAVLENDEESLIILLDRTSTMDDVASRLKCLICGGGDRCSSLDSVETATTNMTPIIAAAYKGNFDLTRILVDRGFYIQKPHPPHCGCEEMCHDTRLKCGETLAESINRIMAYRGLSSPVYLMLSSEDPILSAFELARETDQLSRELPENKKEYKDLSRQCSKFAVDLLNECRNTEEVILVLSRDKDSYDPKQHRFSRLYLAVQYCQKEFVTHPRCQQVLRSMWTEGLSAWCTWSVKQKTLHIITQVLLWPFACLAFILTPRPQKISCLRVPLNRFIYSATSYLVFLFLLIATLLGDVRCSGNSIMWAEITVCLFVLASSLSVASNIISVGPKNYFRSFWATYDFIMYTLFLLAEILAFNKISCITDFERKDSQWHHPVLLGEGIYATASVMAFSRLLYFSSVNSFIGTLGICLKNMVADVFRFLLVFFIVIFAFATGINSIYRNYTSYETKESNCYKKPDGFSTLLKTFKTLFWAIFGMSRFQDADIVVSSGPINGTMNHYFTENVGYFLWALYHLVTVVVLLNMLIGMMADSYQRVQRNADLEWKFASSTLWLTTFDSHRIVPPPFNLIPPIHRLVRMCHCIFGKFRKKTDNKSIAQIKTCCDWNTEVDGCSDKSMDEAYEKLMVQLIRRYLHSNSLGEISSSVPCLPSEIKDKIKFDILNELKRNTVLCRNFSVRRASRKKSSLLSQ